MFKIIQKNGFWPVLKTMAMLVSLIAVIVSVADVSGCASNPKTYTGSPLKVRRTSVAGKLASTAGKELSTNGGLFHVAQLAGTLVFVITLLNVTVSAPFERKETGLKSSTPLKSMGVVCDV